MDNGAQMYTEWWNKLFTASVFMHPKDKASEASKARGGGRGEWGLQSWSPPLPSQVFSFSAGVHFSRDSIRAFK